jgi:D-amino-acid dehydrogenase
MTAPSVVVIGGGVIGTACAHYLSKAGWSVTLVDKGRHGAGCSHANCGFVSPSHVLPLAVPGALGTALRSLLQRNAPFAVRPRFDPALWNWFWRFAKRCNRRDMIAAGHGIQALLNSSRALYEQLMREEPIDCEWQPSGILFVFQTKPAMEHYAETDKLLTETFRMPARRFDGDALTDVEPALKPGLGGGWLYEGDAHLRPDRLLSEWRRVLESRGVLVREHCEMVGFDLTNGRARAAVTSQGELLADAYVVATGAWTPFLNRHLACKVPIQPGKGYSITMQMPARCPKYPLLFEEHHVAVTPMRSGYRLGSTMEFAGYDSTLDRARLQLLRDGARPYLHEPFGEPVTEEWFGWRPMTYDSLPVIDRSPALGNVYIAAGHNMLGLSMATATGRLVTEMLSGQTPHVDPAPYSVRRFSRPA